MLFNNTIDYHVIPLAKNKSVIMYNSYTYSYHMKGKSLLRCSQKVSEKCRAFIKLDKHGNIMRAVTDHTHLPPICEMTGDGYYRFTKHKKFY
uniref:SFRICE_005661 n=1 Tax=Spodoptera frugiperda TaxID=7108 RepID=A0A2H1WAU7_SPOFR